MPLATGGRSSGLFPSPRVERYSDRSGGAPDPPVAFLPVTEVVVVKGFAFCLVAALATVAYADVLQIEGKISALDAAERTLTINDKTYEIAKKCSVSINGNPAKLEDIAKDEAVIVTYDDKFEMVSAIAVGQPTWFFYDFNQSGNNVAENIQVVSDEELSFLPVDFKKRGLLLSGRKFAKCKLRFEVMSSGDGFVAVAAGAPKQEGDGFVGFPFGIEVKLGQGNFGKIILPPNFEAEMVYGQDRKGRDVPPLKKQTPVQNGWNTVEIAVQGSNDVIMKGNGVTLNAIANASSVEGHIIVFAPAGEFRVRNMTVEVDGKTTSLSFDSIAVMPSGNAKPATEANGVVGQFDVQWTESSGNSGSTRYEFKEDGSFLRAGAKGGSWKKAGEGVTMKFADPARGNASVRFSSPDSFEGTHTKSDGTKSTWKGSKVNR